MSSVGWGISYQNCRLGGEVGTGGSGALVQQTEKATGGMLAVRSWQGRDLNASRSAMVAGPGGGLLMW